jgi:hypothetical protein
MPINLDAAKNKLLQAEILYAQLHSLSGDIARDMRRRVGGDYRLPLETYFSACLNAARSCFFVLARTGGQQFKNVSSQWRNNVLDQRARARFNSMINLRDRDVHYGEMGAAVLPKMMEAQNEGSLYVHYNAALYGPQPMAEHENPDGTMVRSPALQSTIGLYVEIGGCLIEATTACADFIAQLHSLLNAAVTADAARTAASGESDAAGQGGTITRSI